MNGWLERGHCPTTLVLSASSTDGGSSLQLSLRSLCHIFKTLSASRLVCSHLYQLPTPAPNFCLSLWVSIPFVITFPTGVLKWTQDVGDGNTSLQHPRQPGGVTHTLAGPTAVAAKLPSLGSASHETRKVTSLAEASQKLCCWQRRPSGDSSCAPCWHHSASPPLHLPGWGNPDKARL